MSCRDWSTTLRPASYRGVPFFVETDGISTGRRLVVHEAPHRDDPFVEDLGRKQNQITVSAYIAGDDIEAQEQRLRTACDQGGAASLELPTIRLQAHCSDCKRDYRKDQQGYMAFNLTFVRQGSAFGPSALLGFARAIEFQVGSLGPIIAAAFSGSFRTLGLPAYVAADAASLVTGFLGEFGGMARGYPLEANGMARLVRDLSDGLANIDELVAVGSVGDRWLGSSFTDTAAEASADDLVDLVVGAFATVGEAAPADHASQFFRAWVDWGSEVAVPAGAGGPQIVANTDAFNNLVRAAALAQYAQAIVLRTYTDRREARQARADAAEFFDLQLMALSGWQNFEAWKNLSELRGKVVDHLHRVIINLAPLVIINAPKRMTALWYSQKLYGTAARADELVERNGVIHAGFMPTQFEASSK